METIIQQLGRIQELQTEAFRLGFASFDIAAYHWSDDPDTRCALAVRASRTDADGDLFYKIIRFDMPMQGAEIIKRLEEYVLH